MEHDDTNGNILDVKGVCRTFRIGRDEVYRLIRSGKLPVMRFGKAGKTLRFLKSDILNLRETEDSCTAQVVRFVKLRSR